MKILHVGNGNEKHLGRRYYDVGRKLNNGFIRNLHNVLFFSDRDVARHATVFGSKGWGKAACNRKLIATARHFRPDFILLGHADMIAAETLTAIRSLLPEVKIAQFNVDPLFRPENVRHIHSKLAAVDATFVTTGGPVLRRVSRPGHQARYLPNPVDRSIETHRCHERGDQPHDLFYAIRATTTRGRHEGSDRLEVPRYLREHLPELVMDFHGFDGVPEIFGADFYDRMAQARMGLNLSQSRTTQGDIREAQPEELYLYSSDRIAQYLGNGLLTFIPRQNHLQTLFSEEEAVYFSSREELADKLRHYRAHDAERRRIATAGWKKAHERFNEQQVARYIIEATFGQPWSEDYAWPTESF